MSPRQPGSSGDSKATDKEATSSVPAAMSKADRANLERLARKRAKVATSMIGERVKVLRRDVEEQLSAEYKFDDQVWADITRAAQVEVGKADSKIADICKQVGVPEHLRPSLTLGWHNRGENLLAERRAELRRLANTRIEAAAESAKVVIQAKLLEVETELIRDGLETAEAVAFVDSMPTPEQLLTRVDVGELEPGEHRSRYDTDEWRGKYGGWSPPPDLAGELLTTVDASSRRERKQQAIERALAANPDGSNRQIAQLAGVDHKTVAKVRAEAGEAPTEAGEVPTDEGGAR